MSELLTTSVTEDTELDGGSAVAKTKTINRDYLADVVSLSVVQLQSAMEYAGIHENECTGAMLNVVSGVAALRESLLDTGVSAPGAVTLPKNIELALSALTKDTTDAITLMQFIDALSQRLSHILFELHQIADFAESNVRPDSPDAWRGLINKIKNMYSIPEERAVFDAVMAKAPIGRLLDSKGGAHHGSDGSVEIF